MFEKKEGPAVTGPQHSLNAAETLASESRLRNAPALVVRFELESAPRVVVDAVNESEFARLCDWLQPYRDLLDRVHELASDGREP